MQLTTYPATLDVAAGLAHYQAAEAELSRGPARRQLGYLYVGMAMGAVFGVRTERLEAASRRALELAEELGDEPMAGWASYLRAWWAFNHGRLAESLSLHERMRDTATRLDDVRMGSWAAFGQAMGSGGELAQARRIAADLEPDTVLERMLSYWSGDWEQAEVAWTAAKDRDGRSGDRLDGTLNAYWLGRVRRLLGVHEAAEAALDEALVVALQGPQVPAEVMLRAELSLLATERGRLESARAELARCQELIGTGEDWRGLAGRVALAAGMLAAADGRPGHAGEAFAAAVGTFHAHACSWDEAEARCLWAKALPAEADRQRAAAAGLYRRMGAGRRWTAWAAEPVP